MRLIAVGRGGALAWGLALAGSALGAQTPPTRRIAKPDVEFPEPFTRITSLRELSDGRVLLADARDRTLQLLDLKSGQAHPVGRQGNGPGEYGLPQALIALPGDTTLLSDPLNSRLLLILPDGTPGPLLRMPEQASPATIGGPRRSDSRGRFYYEVQRRGEPGGRYGASAAEVIRFDRASGRIDTLATLALPTGRMTGSRQLPGGMLQTFTNKPLALQDVAAYGPDGRVAIVRAKTYQVEWIDPDGKRTTGAPVRYEPIRITDAERKAFLESQTTPGSIIVRGPVGGAAVPSGAAPRAVPIPRGSDPFADQPVEWPDYKPAFLAGAAVIDLEGRLWVLKTRRHDELIPVYDIIDGSGRLVERIALPPRTRLVGFGRGVVYLSRSDADDLEWLGRYRL
jgi:hypothetical protein